MIRAACLRYFYVMIFIIVICLVVSLLLEYFYDYRLSVGAGIGMVTWSAMSTGTYWYKQYEGYPTGKVMWQLTIYFSIIDYTLIALLLWILLQDGSQNLIQMHSLTSLKGLKIMGVFALIILLLNRFGFSLGIFDAKRQAKSKLAKEKLAQEKLVEKSGE